MWNRQPISVLIRDSLHVWYRRYQAEGMDGLRTRSKTLKTYPNVSHVGVVGEIIYLPENHHFEPQKIAMYPERDHDVTISKSGVRRILNRLNMGPRPPGRQPIY
ncbi:hypothetical protein ACIP98_41415 [Streptomyces sp. NPDC088354]|uniref:hypothetical protein n=1 Tax=Streptomyces sp. NPDC088354 TaxID=3365856 RepID=UPI003828FE71